MCRNINPVFCGDKRSSSQDGNILILEILNEFLMSERPFMRGFLWKEVSSQL